MTASGIGGNNNNYNNYNNNYNNRNLPIKKRMLRSSENQQINIQGNQNITLNGLPDNVNFNIINNQHVIINASQSDNDRLMLLATVAVAVPDANEAAVAIPAAAVIHEQNNPPKRKKHKLLINQIASHNKDGLQSSITHDKRPRKKVCYKEIS